MLSKKERRLSGSVVVITGASSGIGRAAARRFAELGCKLVLGARRVDALGDVLAECSARGGEARAVPLDVADERSMEELVRDAMVTYGRIDVWINNAAVSALGRFEETPPEDFRRVIETNFFGVVHGTRAAMPVFRNQARGILINVASVVAYVPQPYASAYVASKHAVRGFTDCIRQEVALEKAPDIHICTVLPPSVDTPLFQSAANFAGRAAKPMDPVYPPERIARAIVSLVERPRREIVVGVGKLMVLQRLLAPGLYERLMARVVDRQHFQTRPAAPSHGNLFEPIPQLAMVRGGWLEHGSRSPLAMLLGPLARFMPRVAPEEGTVGAPPITGPELGGQPAVVPDIGGAPTIH